MAEYKIVNPTKAMNNKAVKAIPVKIQNNMFANLLIIFLMLPSFTFLIFKV